MNRLVLLKCFGQQSDTYLFHFISLCWKGTHGVTLSHRHTKINHYILYIYTSINLADLYQCKQTAYQEHNKNFVTFPRKINHKHPVTAFVHKNKVTSVYCNVSSYVRTENRKLHTCNCYICSANTLKRHQMHSKLIFFSCILLTKLTFLTAKHWDLV